MRLVREFAAITFVLTVITYALIPLRANAATQPLIDGWAGYKFGMSPEQAQKVAGLEWGPLSTILGADDKNFSTLRSKGAAQAYGSSFQVDLFFNDRKTLTLISLRKIEPLVSARACEEALWPLVKEFERQYKPFQMLLPKNFKPAPDSEQQIRQVPGTKSSYMYTTSHWMKTFGFDPAFTADAVIFDTDGRLDVRSNALIGQHSSCDLEASFEKH